MQKVKIIVGFLVFTLILSVGCQIASCEFANLELRDDLRDVAAMAGAKIGLLAEASDEDLRDAVLHRAAGHDIHLRPEQVVIKREGTSEHPKIFLAAKYQSRVALPGLRLIFHFTATSR